MMVMLSRRGAWLAVLGIIVLSVVPGNMRPHTLGNDYAEHFVAYFIAGSLFAIGYPSSTVASGSLLAICAGSLEFIQMWIPGRTASTGGFASSTIGACIGLLVIVAIKQAHQRMLAGSYK
jgi:VanZ family protein